MCPSYMATREEMHSTRGRAHLLFEMVQGEVITDGWKSEAVHEALDLCLSCKGCKGECPVNVDMATYKAEFMAHYYAGRLRPRQRLCLRPDRPLGAAGVLLARRREFLHAKRTVCAAAEKARPHRAAAPHHAVRRTVVHRLVRAPLVAAYRRRARHPVARYLQQLFSSGSGARRRCGCWNMPAARWRCLWAPSAAAGRCTNSACWNERALI